jgi:hypothetical protein
MKISRAEAVATATPQQVKPLPAELSEQWRKIGNDQRIWSQGWKTSDTKRETLDQTASVGVSHAAIAKAHAALGLNSFH